MDACIHGEECRTYLNRFGTFPECQRCNEVGDSWIPCAGGSDGIRCKGYEPMPDVKALLALAEELEEETGSVCGVCMGKTARRIRKALGVDDDES